MKRVLQFKNWRTKQVGRAIDVTGKSEREIERILSGMLINIGEDWYVDDSKREALATLENDG